MLFAIHQHESTSLVAQLIKNLLAVQETRVQSLGWEDPPEKQKVTQSSILAWRIPCTIQSMGSQRVGRNFSVLCLGFPCGSAGKRICLQWGRPGFNPWVGKSPWRREWLLIPVFWPGEFHGLYSPWGHKQLDITEQLSLNL